MANAMVIRQVALSFSCVTPKLFILIDNLYSLGVTLLINISYYITEYARELLVYSRASRLLGSARDREGRWRSARSLLVNVRA